VIRIRVSRPIRRLKFESDATTCTRTLSTTFPLKMVRLLQNRYKNQDQCQVIDLFVAPNLRNNRIIVEMINQLGLDEAGIDGGGLFREFILQLLENGFDPNRGFFVLTSDGFLYPNPQVGFLVENYAAHYFFLGRMLAKVIFSLFSCS
jgi:ubiquitin-protein ligase E3 C